MKTFLLTLALMGLVTGSLTLLHGWYSKRQESTQAVASVRESAQKGDRHAQTRLATMFRLGRGVEQNYSKAVDWYRKAADQGEPVAQFFLGLMFRTGEGLPRDSKLAAEWFEKAADQGVAAAQYNLGRMYQNGNGKPIDYTASVKWYRHAAEQGLAIAQYKLGTMYDQGHGVPQDFGSAVSWYQKGTRKKIGFQKSWHGNGSEKGLLGSQYHLGWMYELGRGAEQDYGQSALLYRTILEQSLLEYRPPNPISEDYHAIDLLQVFALERLHVGRLHAQRPSRDDTAPTALPKPATLLPGSNTAPATLLPGSNTAPATLLPGSNTAPAPRALLPKPATLSPMDLVKPDSTKAPLLPFDVLLQFASQPDRYAEQYEVGNRYAKGVDVKKNGQEATKWYRRSALQSFGPAEAEMGLAYENGIGVPQDYEMAEKWFRKAALHNDATAQVRLARLYHTGANGVPKNSTKAAYWYRKASSWGYGETVRTLAVIYKGEASLFYKGISVPKTLAEVQRPLEPAVHSLISMMYPNVVDDRTTPPKEGDGDTPSEQKTNARNLYNLGRAYEHGLEHELAPNYSLAARYYELAAGAKLPQAYTRSGDLYESGRGVPQNFKKALEFYRLGALADDPLAQFRLGSMHAKGRGTLKNDLIAFHWLEKSAIAGIPQAMAILGEIHEEGRSVPPDPLAAALWYRRGVLRNDPIAFLRLHRIYSAESPGSERDTEIFHSSREAAEQGNKFAALLLATMYATGRGVAPDPEQAARWYGRAVEHGLVHALYSMGLLHENGETVPMDLKKAASLYRAALDIIFTSKRQEKGMLNNPLHGRGYDYVSTSPNNSSSSGELADIQQRARDHFMRAQKHTTETALAPNWREAAMWYQKSAAFNYPPAQYNLAIMYQRGQGISLDTASALHWFKQAAMRGYRPAQFALAHLYRTDRSVRNPVLAHKWFNVWTSGLNGEEAVFAGKIREHLAAKLTPTELASAQQMASEWNVP